MSSRKRTRETDVLIKVASGQPLEAESFVLRSFSDSARGLPAAAEEWDVSGLLFDGQPFSRDTVACWLSCAYSVLHSEELGPDNVEQLSTVAGLTQVLAFADAVGSSAGLLTTACSQIKQLQFVVQLPEQLVKLPVVDCCYYLQDSRQLTGTDLQERVSIATPWHPMSNTLF